MELYKYQPLSTSTSIRVIALEPALEDSSPLTCELHHRNREFSLSTESLSQSYEAVSYTWATTPIFSSSLLCDHGQRRIPITPEVYEMLQRLRKPTRARYLWVDAICLNQADLAEKAMQIPLMGDIYKQARKTHVYLSSASLTLADLDLFHYFHRVCDLDLSSDGRGARDRREGSVDSEQSATDDELSGTEYEHSGSDDEPAGTDNEHPGNRDEHLGTDDDDEHLGTDDEHLGTDDEHSGTDDEHSGNGDEHSGNGNEHSGNTDEHSAHFGQVYQAIDKLTQDPWFRRRWILQEVAFSHHAIIRTRGAAMPWQLFIKISNSLISKSSSKHIDANIASSAVYTMSVVSRLGSREGHKNILELLEHFHASECTELLDRLYSLYSLARQQWSLPKVNYALSYVDVYAQLAHACPSICESWWKFGSLWHVDNSMPSWVPNWSRSAIETVHPELKHFATTRKVERGNKWFVEEIGKIKQVFQPLGDASSMQELAKLLRPFHDPRESDGVLDGYVPRMLSHTLKLAGDSHDWRLFLHKLLAASQRCETDGLFGARAYRNPEDEIFFGDTGLVLSTWNKLMKNSCLATVQFNESGSNGRILALVPASAMDHDLVVKFVIDLKISTRHFAIIRKTAKTAWPDSLLERSKHWERDHVNTDGDLWLGRVPFNLLGRVDGLEEIYYDDDADQIQVLLV